MKNLRRSIVTLLVTLAIFFNLERLDIDGTNTIDMPSFIYVLILVAIVAILLLPRSRQLRLHTWFMVWTAIYLLGKILFFDAHILIESGGYIYITITEVGFLLFSIFMSCRIASHLHDFEEAVINISFPGVKNRVFDQENGWDALQTEINRGRRYQRPVSVVAIEPGAVTMEAALNRSVREVQQAMMSRYMFLGLARIVSQQIRRMDMAMERDGQDRLIIVCPETNGNAVETLVQRINYVAHEQLGLSICYGVASFPESALTATQLVEHAEHNIQRGMLQQPEAPTESSEPADQTDNTERMAPAEALFQDR
jgi:hypothetical protein